MLSCQSRNAFGQPVECNLGEVGGLRLLLSVQAGGGWRCPCLTCGQILWPCKTVLCEWWSFTFDLYRSATVPIKRSLRSEPSRQEVSRKQIPGHLSSFSVAFSSRTSFLGAAGSYLLLLVLGTHATGHQKSFVAAQIPKNILG